MDTNAKNVGTGMVGAPACGDVMRLQIEVNDKDVLTDCKFRNVRFCGSAIASSQQMIEMLIGKSLEEAKNIKDREMRNWCELPSIKIHAGSSEDKVKKAIADYESRKHKQNFKFYYKSISSF